MSVTLIVFVSKELTGAERSFGDNTVFVMKRELPSRPRQNSRILSSSFVEEGGQQAELIMLTDSFMRETHICDGAETILRYAAPPPSHASWEMGRILHCFESSGWTITSPEAVRREYPNATISLIEEIA